jgi:hypothetical protein
LRESIEEATIEEEKAAHEKHFSDKGFEWYYFGSSIDDINKTLNEYGKYFNKKVIEDGVSVKYCSYKITDDKTKETIGWFGYILSSYKDEQGNQINNISNIKIKQEVANSKNNFFNQALKHLMESFQNNDITLISWEALDSPENKRIKQYAHLCKQFGGTTKIDDNRIKFILPRESIIKNKDNIFRYFRLN